MISLDQAARMLEDNESECADVRERWGEQVRDPTSGRGVTGIEKFCDVYMLWFNFIIGFIFVFLCVCV